MSDSLKLFELPPSPNNMKVRIALNYKELPFEQVLVDPQDRTELVKITGQPLTPALQHGQTVVWDSAAILRYLDGNFPDTPRIFSPDRDTIHEIEGWERFGRSELAEPVLMVIRQLFAGTEEAEVMQKACALLNQVTGRIEERLAEGSWLVGESMTAADITAGPVVHYGMLPEGDDGGNPLADFFSRNLRLGDGRERTREWARRVMAYCR